MANIGSFTDNDLSNNIKDTAHTVGDKVRDRIDGAGARLGDLADKAQERVVDAKGRVMNVKERAMRSADELGTNARQQVRSNPIMAVAIGVGVGFILGRVLFR